MVITSTPLRVSFFGGGTDYPVWYREHGGSVLATTIDKSCFITADGCRLFSSTTAVFLTRRWRTSA